ncbi:metallophosphoesterase [Desulfobulbus alkaliphilus]|uniref:metallophosphoesterase n=1 Tax=Desulfobulbus alkaliphilus TaxID=869814 RepID=UPI00196509D1|nr:metallophosphoesterase [Desulfobulbus alkaliphilus]MBM9537241.1 metallophosphoesterase [Desulfobulbus alkaliphilus]
MKNIFLSATMPASSSTTCVIGDIHGCHTALTLLLPKILHRADSLVFLGDYVDRGPHSKEVVATLISLQRTHPRVIYIMGNHDLLFLQYLSGQESALFLRVGGRQTLASYGLDPAGDRDQIARLVPPEHLAFLKSLPLYWEDSHAIYVHAGLQPGRHLAQQTSQWCLWAGEEFYQSTYDFGKPVVFGHTTFKKPLLTINRIGIDTGAVYGGRLTALLLPDREVVSVPGNPENLSF